MLLEVPVSCLMCKSLLLSVTDKFINYLPFYSFHLNAVHIMLSSPFLSLFMITKLVMQCSVVSVSYSWQVNNKHLSNACDGLCWISYMKGSSMFSLTPAGTLSANMRMTEQPQEKCCLVVDSGYSFTHIAPYHKTKKVSSAIRRSVIISCVAYWNV